METREDKRSRQAEIAERILRAVNDGHLSSAEASEQFLRKRSAEEDGPFPLAPLVHAGHGSLVDFEGIQVIVYGELNSADKAVLYLHGGAYTEEILPFHMNFCSRMAARINAYVIVPLYPLAPNHTWRETYVLLTDLYEQILANKRVPLTIMGDSAGGGLAAAFCQYLNRIRLAQPDHLVCLSPWVDICMTDSDYGPYRPTDPMLDVPGLQTIGKAWAGELDVRDPRVSPTFGDCSGLPKTLIFTGTREILYPDILAFYEKMKAAGCDVELIVEEGMNHVYPLYGLPESRTAVARIYQEISA